jgi:hypothetical protein
LVFQSDITFNIIYAYISIIFVSNVTSYVNNELKELTVGGMFEDTITYDCDIESVIISYLSFVLVELNKSSSSGDKSFSTSYSNSSNNIKKSNNFNKSSNSLSLSNGTKPSGNRSYSSLGTSHSNLDSRYSCTIPISGKITTVYFDNITSMKLFLKKFLM